MDNFVPTRPPRLHQAEAAAEARGKASFFYLMEMGLGKSKVVLDEAFQLYVDGTIDRILIVAGAGSYADWLHKHLPENVPDYMRVVAHLWDGGSTKAEQAKLQSLMFTAPGYGRQILRVLVMNVETFSRAGSVGETVARNFMRSGPAEIICDESTKIRNDGAQRSKTMIELAKLAKVRRALTGLATPKNPLDLWGQMKFLGLEHVLGSNWFSFRARYCELVTHQHQRAGAPSGTIDRSYKITGYKNLDHLADLLKPHSFRALKKDCLDLPPKIYETATVELTVQQRSAYRDMLKLATTELADGKFASAVNAVTRIKRLHQITLGFLVDEEGQYHELESNRIEIMSDVIEEMEGKVIVWCAYQPDVRRVCRRLRETYSGRGAVVEYYGPTPAADRAAGVQAFQGGDAAFFVGTSQTGGFGITLTAASNTIYYSNSFDLEHRLQSEDRNHRDGTTSAVTYVDLVARGTVDRKILKALQDKKRIADVLMDGSIQQWLELPE